MADAGRARHRRRPDRVRGQRPDGLALTGPATVGLADADGPPAEVLTAALLSEVYECRVDVIDHPRRAGPLVLPSRPHRGCG